MRRRRRRRTTTHHLALRHVLHHRLLRHPRLLFLINPPATRSKIRAIEIRQFLSLRRRPVLAIPRLDTEDVHGVDFLEAAALALAQEEVDDDGAGETATCEDVAVAVVDAGGDEGGEEGEQEVPDPVAGGCEGHALCPVVDVSGVDSSLFPQS
jgi:hypothetical protein